MNKTDDLKSLLNKISHFQHQVSINPMSLELTATLSLNYYDEIVTEMNERLCREE